MDETAEPQSPVEMLFILAAIADEKIPAQTIAPKFSGRFNKGVDYIGDVNLFRQEFEEDLCVIKYAVEHFGLPQNLKLIVHSGSDKFSIYRPISEKNDKHGTGNHVKTVGTTWLKELIGLAEAGEGGLLEKMLATPQKWQMILGFQVLSHHPSRVLWGWQKFPAMARKWCLRLLIL